MRADGVRGSRIILLAALRNPVPVVLEQPGDPLGVVLVHLAPEGADGVGPGHDPRLRPLAYARRSTEDLRVSHPTLSR